VILCDPWGPTPDITEQASQGALLATALWEAALAGGAVGVHVFHWSYRPWLTTREQGFGVVNEDRTFTPSVDSIKALFSILFQFQLDTKWLPGSQDPKPDVGFYWTSATDQVRLLFFWADKSS